MNAIQQRAAEFNNNESSVADDDDDGDWVSNPFQLNIYNIIQAAKFGYTNETINPPETVELEDNLKESNSTKEIWRGILSDHSYELPHGLRCSRFKFEGNQTDLLNDDEETVDAHAENHWKPVREVKEQFIIRTNPLSNHLISSFDVACVEELNPDGSPVEKMHVVSSCAVHGENEQGCTMCTFQPASKLVFENARNGVHLRCIDNKVNRVPHVKSREKKADESLDITENGENDVIKKIYELIAGLKHKKGKKQTLVCEMCEKRFTVVTSLRNHYLGHGNIRLFSCNLCNGTFTRKNSLNYHMLVHKNKYPLKCKECPRKFRHKTHYKDHIEKHRAEKLFKSSSSFKNRNTLNRHVKAKHLKTEGKKIIL